MLRSQVIAGSEKFVFSLAIERHREEKVGRHYPNAAQAQMVRFINITNI